MFSRGATQPGQGWGRQQNGSSISSAQGRGNSNGNNGNRRRTNGKEEYASPLNELIKRMDRVGELVHCSRMDFLHALSGGGAATPTRRSAALSIVNSLKKLRKRLPLDEALGSDGRFGFGAPASGGSAVSSIANLSLEENAHIRRDAPPRIVAMAAEDISEMIECLRRIAELVIVSERVVAKESEIQEKLRSTDGSVSPEEKEELRNSRSPDSEQYSSLFDEFFERSGLELIVNIATGKCFDITVAQAQSFDENDSSPTPKNDASGNTQHGSDDGGDDGDGGDGGENNQQQSSANASIDSHDSKPSGGNDQLMCLLLPPISVATQAVQSISIMVQNVSRATSLYFILSGNHVNELIQMPLDKLKQADWNTRAVEESLAQRKHASPEISELTTHFVTFLKSLALRMNAETLQFFLTYPMEQIGGSSDEDDDDDDAHSTAGTQTASSSHFSEHSQAFSNGIGHDPDDDRPLDEITEDRESLTRHSSQAADTSKPVVMQEVVVKFPLYARALEFCAAHQDNFIRVTAMNICLNTLRLATVQPINEDGSNEVDFEASSSPDGVLHNAKPLPFRERLSIAQHVCSPSRVERLVSPIFTKLAQLWGILEEKFREVGEKDASSQSRATAKIALAKETSRRKRMTAAFKDIAFKLQDELELLEDVLKVGLTSLNEQVIEMMLATFVYPLLMQPMLLYFQRAKVPDSVLFADTLHDHTTGRRIKPVDYADAEKSFISAPAKSAFFMLTAVFYSVTNRPLLNLLFCALFHPLSPDASGETMIRAKADVACVDANGKKSIRVDPVASGGSNYGNGSRRVSAQQQQPKYLFGTVTGEKLQSMHSPTNHDPSVCTFVLAPALAEVLQSTGDDLAIIARSRHNPYRRAIFQCCRLSHELSDLKPLSIMAIDAAVSSLDETFVVDVLQGVKFQKRFREATPGDERRSDSSWARSLDDRGMGGPAARESRMSLQNKGNYDFLNEMLSSFKSSLIYATPGCNGNWKLVFDPVAAHALLCSTRGSSDVLSTASTGSTVRSRQAAGFLSDMPQAIEKYLGSAWVFSKDPELRSGMITDVLFFSKSTSNNDAVVDKLRSVTGGGSIDEGQPNGGSTKNFVAPVSFKGDFDELCTRACSFPPAQYSTNDASIEEAMSSIHAWLQADAFCNFIRTVGDHHRLQSSERKLTGFALMDDGQTMDVNDHKAAYGLVSPPIQSLLFNSHLERAMGSQQHQSPLPSVPNVISSGNIISLMGQTAIPCVCEAPPSSAYLFSSDSAKTISEGVTWQSLYLVLLNNHFILAEPHNRSSGDGRVVTACPLQTTEVKQDQTDAAESTVARRLLIHQRSYTQKAPPGLFLRSEDESSKKNKGSNCDSVASSLDIWFENQNAAQQAFGIMNDAILRAKAQRGMNLRRYLAEFRT